ncbi:MAG TPA: hypothetical protein VEX17_01895 [Bacillales bacterium]|nr:hypothetical protein [Bacillales bacterium]
MIAGLGSVPTDTWLNPFSPFHDRDNRKIYNVKTPEFQLGFCPVFGHGHQFSKVHCPMLRNMPCYGSGDQILLLFIQNIPLSAHELFIHLSLVESTANSDLHCSQNDGHLNYSNIQQH